MATLKSSTNITTSLGHSYDFGLNSGYTEVFEVTQQIDNNDDYIKVATFTPNSKAAASLEGAELVVISNPSDQVIEVRLTYNNWEGTSSATSDTNDSSPASTLLCHLIRPNEYIVLPNIHGVGYDTAKSASNGTVIDNQEPASALYVDSTQNLTAKLEDDATVLAVDDGDFFRVGDLVQVGITTGTTATNIEIMKVTAISGNNLTVTRGVHGSIVADGDAQTNATNGAVSGANVHFPIFNALYDYRYKILGSTTQRVATDGNGNALFTNFFGYGRSGTETSGLTKGSVALKFYDKGHTDFTFKKPITPLTDSGLTAGHVHSLKFTLDDASELDLQVTLDSTVTAMGGRNGVVQKIQDAINTASETSGNNIFGYGMTVAIVDGKLRFQSRSNFATISKVSFSTTSSAGAANGYFLGNGIFPSASDDPVLPSLPPDTVENTDGISVPNTQRMLLDNGYGQLVSANPNLGSAMVDYNTGKLQIQNGLPHAEFVVSASTQSALSGGPIANTCLASIHARSTNSKRYATVQILAFN